ncbi:putative toxin-antitoxin system toxin component, PIN family [Cyanobacterium sp. Dongsha4]|uniref:putative toxin-antitoxin system toxin component, PIN family n=1 Tax=Cyanobacterium sp. DS4 TaxID=2878255 RepID=UPI002E823BD6|nr:putative toxin-antitoxin system toxin component, PIN family [Cyanobacterium sp. Dongsha4]WVL02105.1 putative toxin-antitoxin system toxin component, PIN family [Cyanobacterium sp. Dongsha4]
MIRVVIDTNIFVSALLFENSLPFQVVKLAEKTGIILFSEATLGELKQVLSRKKFDKYVTLQEREAFLLKLMTAGENVVIHRKITACRDEKDNKFLELAINGNADFIITGDNDLLVLNPFENIPIINPDVFINSYQ